MSSLFKAIKKGRVNHWTWKLALLLVLTLYLFFKIKGNDQRWSDIEIKEPILLLFVACCGFIQWLVEWKKWEIVCSTAKVGVGNIEREKAFYGGIISGFILPGGIFNFIGRMLPFTTIENRILLPLTWYSNASQFLPSVFFGLIALFLFGFKIQLSDLLIPIFEWKTLIVSMSFFALAVFLFTPFEKIKWFRMKFVFCAALDLSFRLKVTSLSFLRYFLFMAQFYGLICFFDGYYSLDILFAISLIYLFTSVSPNLFFGKIVVRELIALWILGNFGLETSLILWVTFSIWIINHVLPVAWSGFKLLKNNG